MLSAAERCCLEYLDPLMWASCREVGGNIYAAGHAKGSNINCVGAATLGRLRKRGFVAKLADVGAWRITRHGREALAPGQGTDSGK